MMHPDDIREKIGKAIKEAEADALERKDNKSEILIINKENGEIVDRILEWPSQAEKVAKNKIWNRPYLKYQIITVVS